MNPELISKVKRECTVNFSMAKRRFEFLKSMPKSIRPIEWQESIEAWQEGIRQYEESNEQTFL